MKLLLFFLFPLSFFLYLPQNSFAEYRVYQFYISSKANSNNAKSYLVTSTMAPHTYLSYHGGDNLLEIHLLRTWICPGHTGGLKEVCPSPYKNYLKTQGKDKKK